MAHGKSVKLAGFNRKASDRISELPSELKHLILEHLPVDEIARTSVLCSQWRRVFRDHPNLLFHTYLSNWIKREYHKGGTLPNEPGQVFLECIKSILLAHSCTIDNFSVRIPHMKCAKSTAITLVDDVIRLLPSSIMELWIECEFGYPVTISPFKKLTCLQLEGCSLDSHSTFTSFTQLTELYLRRIKIPHDFIQPLSRIAPSLKRLCLISCPGPLTATIDVPSLIEFVMTSCDEFVVMFKHARLPNVSSVVLSFPSVLSGFDRVLPKLTRLELLNYETIEETGYYSSFIPDLILLLQRAKNVEELTIEDFTDSNCSDVLEKCIRSFKELRLDRLQTLSFEFTEETDRNLFLMRSLIACSPPLVNLNITYVQFYFSNRGSERIQESLSETFCETSLNVKINFT